MEHKFLLILKKNSKFVFFGILIIILFFLDEKLFLFGALTTAVAISTYYHDKYNKTTFDLRLGLFLGIVVAYYYNLWYAVIAYVIGLIIPNLFAGGRIDAPSLVFHLLYVLLFGIATLFPNLSLIILGLILVFADGIIGVFINISLGVPHFMAILSAIVAVSIRIVYFLTLGRLVEFIFALI